MGLPIIRLARTHSSGEVVVYDKDGRESLIATYLAVQSAHGGHCQFKTNSLQHDSLVFGKTSSSQTQHRCTGLYLVFGLGMMGFLKDQCYPEFLLLYRRDFS